MKKFVYLVILPGMFSFAIPPNEGGELEPRELCTGLRDSKGNEVREGDILREENGYMQVLEYGNNVDGDGYPHVGFVLPDCDYEVIGNIYEHSHLLPKPTNG